MGQSTDAILVYGFDLGEDWAEDGLENMIPDDIIEKIQRMEGFYDLHEGITDYLKANGVEHGVEIINHCSCDYSMKLLGIEVSRAWRGDVRHLDLVELEHRRRDEVWDEHVQLAANLLGIPEKDAGWLLVSMWC